MRKESQLAALWPQIYRKLKTPPVGVSLGDFPSKLPSMDKININPGRLQENSRAVGYVSTEDTDNNGILDVIHISSPRLEEALSEAGVSLSGIQSLDNLSNEQLVELLTPFVELLSHEMGHLNDFVEGSDNPFPGGEGVADAAARSAVEQITVSTTNINNKFDKIGSLAMDIKTLKILANLATKLDKKGATKVADYVERMMEKYSQDDWLGRKSFPQRGQADTDSKHLDQEMADSVSRMKDGMKGKIQPAGDPYTYDFNKNRTFTVATAPRGKERVVGRVIRPGSPGYEVLMEEAKRLGLASPSPRDRVPVSKPAEAKPASSEVKSLLRKLKMNPTSTADEAAHSGDTSYNLFKKKMASLSDRVIRNAFSGFFGGGAVAGVIKISAEKLASETLTGPEALKHWSSIVNAKGIDAKKLAGFERDFKYAMRLWDQSLDFQRLSKLLRESKADDGELEGEGLDKEASLKEVDYRQVFWFGGSNPFNRSNAKFKG